MKKLTSLILCLLLILTLAGCGAKSEAETFKVGTLKGPSSIGLVQLIDSENLIGGKTSVSFDIEGAPDNIVAKLLNGELDAACVPINLAPVLYNKTNGQIVMTSVATKGVLHIVTKNENVTSFGDLSGKTVYASGKGSTPQYILDYLIEKNNVKDVNVVYLSEHAEVVATLIAKGGIALLPEPFVTTAKMQDSTVTDALDVTKVWEETNSETGIFMTAFVVKKDYLEANPNTVKLFLKAYKESTEFANSNPEAAGELSEKYGIVAKAAIAKAAIPGCNLIYMGAKDNMDTIQKFYQVLYDANKQSVGGKMPSEDFYR